jgi:hypothetical protein
MSSWGWALWRSKHVEEHDRILLLNKENLCIKLVVKSLFYTMMHGRKSIKIKICTYITGINSSLQWGRDMSQGVSQHPLTAEARIRFQDSPSEICGGQRGNNKGFCVSGFPLSVPFHQCYLIISICMFVLPEGRTGEVWELKQCSFVNRIALNRKVVTLHLFRPLNG